jgi:hypothetical protein
VTEPKLATGNEVEPTKVSRPYFDPNGETKLMPIEHRKAWLPDFKPL